MSDKPKPSRAQLRRLEQLQARLLVATHWDAEYGSNLSNQLSTALAALHRLGASDQRLVDFSKRYSTRLHPAPGLEPWAAGDPWRGRFGDPRAWPAYRHLFRQWLAHEGIVDVLQQVLPPLMQGCGAAAFHGMSRVACAFEAVAPEELADGLAYWACRWMDLGSTPAAPAGMTPVRDPAKLVPGLEGLAPSPAPHLAVRMFDAAPLRGFDAAVAPLEIDEDTLPRLARLGSQRYARGGSFTLLQLVTSAQALRVLLPFVDDGAAAVAAYWRAYAAAVVAAQDAPGRAAPLLDWPVLVQAAIASDDAHLVRLVDACRQEQAAHGGAPDWQRAASRAVHDAVRAATEPAC